MAEKVGIEINLINADEAEATLKRIEAATKRLGAKRTKIQMEDGSLVSVDERIKQIQDRLAALSAAKKMGVITKAEVQEAKRLSAELKVISRGLKDGTANAKTFGQVFNSISSKVAHAGSAMQSMGNALTRIGGFMRPITSGLLMGAGYKALNLFAEGFDNAFERADTMKNYDRTLKALGLDVAKTFSVAGKEAKTAKENLDDAVQGLPTSLDEIMAAQKVYAGATGEMVESTKTAIAANNTFLASGMGAREQRFMQKYLVAMASGAELTTTQWQSMARIAPLAMRAVSKELGYADDEYAQFTKDVQQGTIAGEEFLKAFQKVGVSGVVADAARAQTESWNGLFSNIRIAVTRMGANVLDVLNQTFKDATGRTLLQRLLGWDAEGKDLQDGIKSWINGISESVQNWIKANPDRILEFFNTLKGIDFKGLLKGVAEGMGTILDIMERLARIASNKDMSKIGKFLSMSGFFGRALTILGGITKGSRHPIALFGTLGLKLLGKIGNSGIFGKIASIFGKKKDIQSAGDVAKTIPSVADTFKSAFSSLSGLIKAAGAITLVAGTGFIAFKSAKSILQDLKDMVDLVNGGGWDNVGYVGAGIITAIGTFTEIFNAIGTALGPQGLLSVAIASAASTLVTGSFAADMWLIKSGLQNVRNTILEFDKIGDAITNMKGLAGISTGDGSKLKTSVDAIREIVRTLSGSGGGPIDRGQPSGGIPLFTSFKANSLANIANAIAQLKNVVTQLNQLGAMRIVNNPETVINSIKQACDKLQGIRGPKNIDKHTQKVANALIQIRRMAYHINKLAGTSVDTGGFASFVEQIRTALNGLKDLNGELMLDVEVKLSPLFGSSVEAVKTNIKNAKRDIEKMKSPIRFTIPVYVTFSVTTNLSAALAKIRGDRQILNSAGNGSGSSGATPNAGQKHGGVQQAMGGLIYRAGGGGVPFRRRGTDTVPAMLTPGEYVHNKRAVSAFGIDFMRKVNNLDMKGAMNELMHRAGHMANINRGATITNNNYNNQKVVINNSNAGAGYTFKTASRFVGAF